MSRKSAGAGILLLLFAISHTASAQIPEFIDPGHASAPAAEPARDPLGRSTPRSAVAAFSKAAARNDFAAAAQYMQLEPSQLPHTQALGRDLKALMDRYFAQALTSISDSPLGAVDDGLPLDRERVGPLVIGAKRIPIELVRVEDPQSGRVWLISSATLLAIPALHAAATQSWIERSMPRALVSHGLLGISFAHWIVFAASLLVPGVLLMLAVAAFVRMLTWLSDDVSRRREIDAWYRGIRAPLIALLTLAAQLMSIPHLGFPLTFRMFYGRLGLILFVIALAWLLRELLALGFARARALVPGKEHTSTRSLLLLGERLLKALMAVVAVAALLMLVGVDAKTALAVFGIVGVALALGAQKTVENLLGGVLMLTDRAIAVGDLCSISNRLGWIEDITLRSVRMRTLENSLVSVPAGVLAQAGIENFATREKILAQTLLRLRHGTSSDQLRRILDGIRNLLQQSPRIEASTSRIRLVNFAAEAIELELFAYVLTWDVPEFLAIREELLLRIAAIVEAEGSAFAMPTQFIYQKLESHDELPRGAAVSSIAGSDVRLQSPLTTTQLQNETIAANQ